MIYQIQVFNQVLMLSTQDPRQPLRHPSRTFNGVNHLKLPCNDILTTGAFYEKLLPFTRIHEYNHYTPDHRLFAIMLQHQSTNLIIELRHVPSQAEAQKGWDPITWGVGTRADLEEWAAWFDEYRVRRSKIFVGIKGWVMCHEDPNGRIVRLYVG